MKQVKVVAGIIKKDGKYLCTQRNISKYVYNSYKWEFPGGKLEVGETNEMALKRELKEELDIDVDIKEFYCGIKYVYPDFELSMYLYKCDIISGDIKLNVHKNYLWLALDELKTVEWTRADELVINKLIVDETKKR